VHVDAPEVVTLKNVIMWTVEQLPLWKSAPQAQFEGTELKAVEDDFQAWEDASGDDELQLKLKAVLFEDWCILETVDESLKGIDII
jgi:hypothetical protein